MMPNFLDCDEEGHVCSIPKTNDAQKCDECNRLFGKCRNCSELVVPECCQECRRKLMTSRLCWACLATHTCDICGGFVKGESHSFCERCKDKDPRIPANPPKVQKKT